MNEYDSPNYASYSYEKKNVGKVRLYRTLMIVGYVLYTLVFFLICYASGFIPVFAVAPVTLWIIIFFTWRLVAYDVYFEFKSGMLELGHVKVTKSGRVQSPKLSIHVKEATFAAPLSGNEAFLEGNKLYDFSESPTSENRILIIFENDGKSCAAVFEGTAKIANLLSSFCPKAKDLKGKIFHG